MLPRSLPFLVALVALLATPGLMAATSADDERAFTLSPFRQETTYTYDATYRLMGAETAQWEIPGYLTVYVGRAEQGHLPIRITRHVAPWDLDRLPTALGTTILGATGTIQQTLFLDTRDGSVRHIGLLHDLSVWTGHVTDRAPGEDLWHTGRTTAPRDVAFTTTTAWPGTSYAPGEDGPSTYAERGRMGDRTVYRLGDAAPHSVTIAARSPTCEHPYPEPGGVIAPAREPDHAPRTTVLTTRAAWFDPAIPFPVLSVCNVMRPHDDGGMRTQVAYELTLSDHTEPGPAIHIPRPAPPAASQTGSDRADGVPGDRSDVMAFPLHEAYADASRVEDMGYRHFRNDDGTPLVLGAASYQVHPIEPQQEDDVTILRHEVERTLDSAKGQEPLRLTWTLTLRNDRGNELLVQVERRVESDGSMVAAGKEARDFRLAATDVTAALAPLDVADLGTVLTDWQQVTKQDLDAWQHSPDAALHHDLDAGTITIGWTNHGFREQRVYGLEDGALQKEGRWESTPRADAPPSRARGVPLGPSAIQVVPMQDGMGIAERTGLWAAAALFAVTAFQTIKWLLPKLAAAPLYAKISRERVLDHRTRDDIVHFIEANPGANAEEVRRGLGLGRGTTLHHLDTLERNRLVVSVKSRGRRCYFRPGQMDASRKQAFAALKTPAAEAFFANVSANPGTTQKELAAALGVSHPAVWYQAKKLAEAGAIRLVREGAQVRYYPVETTPPASA